MHDPAYARAVDTMLDKITSARLATPTRVAWGTHPKPHLTVQVADHHFREWLDAITVSVVDTKLVGRDRHTHAFGYIGDRPAPQHRIHLIAVAIGVANAEGKSA